MGCVPRFVLVPKKTSFLTFVEQPRFGPPRLFKFSIHFTKHAQQKKRNRMVPFSAIFNNPPAQERYSACGREATFPTIPQNLSRKAQFMA